MGRRANTHTIDMDLETTFAVENPDFDANKKRIDAFSVTQVAEFPAKDNPAIKNAAGDNAPALGFPYETSTLAFSVAMVGLETPAGDTVTATTAKHAIMLLAHMGDDPEATARLTTGDVVLAATDEHTLTETVSGSHAVGNILPCEMATSGDVIARPIATYAAGAIETEFDYPEIPAIAAVLFGASELIYVEDEGTGTLPTVQAEVIGQSLSDNRRHMGMIGTTFSVPDSNVPDIPEITVNYRTSAFDDLFAETQAPGVVPAPTVQGRGEFVFGARDILVSSGGDGSGGINLCEMSLSIDVDGTPAEILCNQGGSDAIGIDGWFRGDGQNIRFTLTLPDDFAAPTGIESGSATMRESWRANKDGIVDRFFFSATYGPLVAGRCVTFWFPDLIQIAEPQIAVLNGNRSAMMYSFGTLQGGDTPKLRIAWW